MGTKNANADAPYVPPEITSAYSRPPYYLYQKGYMVVFTTDADALEGILPEGFSPLPGYEDCARIIMNLFEGPDNDIRPYWEFILEVPAIFNKKPCSYVVQLYLGSVTPEANVMGVSSGQMVYGFPKREGIFHVSDTFGHNYCRVEVERFARKIMEVTFEKLQEPPDLSVIGFYPSEDIVVLKAIPAVDGNGWEVLQLNDFTGEGCEDRPMMMPMEVKYKAVKAQFNGPIVLDTGRKIPVNEIIFEAYMENDWCFPWGRIVHDYLAEE